MKYRDIIYKVALDLQKTGVYENNAKIMQVLFLKSIIDDANKYKNNNIETLSTILNFMQSLNSNCVTEELLYKTMKAVEKANNLSESSLSSALDSYRFYFEKDNQTYLNKVINSIILPSSFEERKELVLDLADYVASNGLRYQSEFIGSPTVNKIASALLDTKETDDVLNTFAGYSTFALTNEKYNVIDGYEKNTEVCALSNMIKVFCNLERMNTSCQDAYSNLPNEKKYDKVLTEGPMAMKVNVLNDNEQINSGVRDSDILNVKMTIDSLKDNGRGLVVFPNKLLIAGAKPFVTFRNELKTCGVKAIISLANNCLYATALPINILVIDKGYSGNVSIVKLDDAEYYDSGRQIKMINDKGVEMLDRIINKGEVIDGVSTNVSAEELFKDGSEPILLQKYFFKEEKKTFRSIKDIDADIKVVLEQLRENN